MTSFDWTRWVLEHTGARAVTGSALLQNLWGGYGELCRLSLEGGALRSVILKRVVPPRNGHESVSDQRKRRSYEVERSWYRHGSPACDEGCRVARCYGVQAWGEGSLLLLEDLNTAGFYAIRPPTAEHVRGGLAWLSCFHSRFLERRPPGLWEQGSYWHFDTRQEEWQRMPAGPLKDHARAFDQRLKGARYQTLLHGDAKPANFCWSAEGQASAVDFQYVGPGCGIRDVAYFLDCCLGDSASESTVSEWLELYFKNLRRALKEDGHEGRASDLEAEWRSLFPVALSDFCRWEQGWGRPFALSPYAQRQLNIAVTMRLEASSQKSSPE